MVVDTPLWKAPLQEGLIMNELVTHQQKQGLAISDDTKASIVLGVSGNAIKGAPPHASLVVKLQEIGI